MTLSKHICWSIRWYALILFTVISSLVIWGSIVASQYVSAQKFDRENNETSCLVHNYTYSQFECLITGGYQYSYYVLCYDETFGVIYRILNQTKVISFINFMTVTNRHDQEYQVVSNVNFLLERYFPKIF